MAPRMTVQQAIESLKIHQIRRENSAIYNQVQDLQGETSKIRDTNCNLQKELDETKANLQKVAKLVAQNNDRLDKTTYTLQQHFHEEDHIQSSINALQKQNKDLSEDVQARHRQVASKINTLDTMNKNFVKKFDTVHQKLCDQLDQTRNEIAERITCSELETIKVRLDLAEKSITAVHSKCHDTGSASRGDGNVGERVKHSVREAILGGQAQQSVYVVESSTTESPVRHLVPFDSGELMAQNPSVLDDLDLDETGVHHGYTGHCHVTKPFNDSLVMLPYLTKDTARSSQAPRDNVARAVLADVLVPETESIKGDSGPGNEEEIQSKPKYLRLQPRRSQRLADRLRAQAQTQATEPMETETQAEASDARVALAAKAMDRGEQHKTNDEHTQLEKCRYPIPTNNRSRLANARKTTHIEVKTTGAGIAETPKHKRACRRDRGRMPNHQYGVPLDISSDTETEQMLTTIHTPTRKLFASRPIEVLPQTPIRCLPSPTNFDKQQVQRFGYCHPVPANLIPSPYDPQPRLVRPQEMSLPPLLPSADSDTFLPQPEQLKAQVDAPRTEMTPPRKRKGRVPLPPPPEIPILSTSTEDDQRFDRW